MCQPIPHPSILEPEEWSDIHQLCLLWGIEDIENEIRVEFSTRMTRSLGRTQVKRKIIRLSACLSGPLKKHIQEVICHELAHIAVEHKYGDNKKPHGTEWQSFVKLAGYEPSMRMVLDRSNLPKAGLRKFKHKCLVCSSERFAKVRMTRWRCSSCVETGLEGMLTIEEVL